MAEALLGRFLCLKNSFQKLDGGDASSVVTGSHGPYCVQGAHIQVSQFI